MDNVRCTAYTCGGAPSLALARACADVLRQLADVERVHPNVIAACVDQMCTASPPVHCAVDWRLYPRVPAVLTASPMDTPTRDRAAVFEAWSLLFGRSASVADVDCAMLCARPLATDDPRAFAKALCVVGSLPASSADWTLAHVGADVAGESSALEFVCDGVPLLLSPLLEAAVASVWGQLVVGGGACALWACVTDPLALHGRALAFAALFALLDRVTAMLQNKPFDYADIVRVACVAIPRIQGQDIVFVDTRDKCSTTRLDCFGGMLLSARALAVAPCVQRIDFAWDMQVSLRVMRLFVDAATVDASWWAGGLADCAVLAAHGDKAVWRAAHQHVCRSLAARVMQCPCDDSGAIALVCAGGGAALGTADAPARGSDPMLHMRDSRVYTWSSIGRLATCALRSPSDVVRVYVPWCTGEDAIVGNIANRAPVLVPYTGDLGVCLERFAALAADGGGTRIAPGDGVGVA